MQEIFRRTAIVLGEEALNKLSSRRVAVFGLGGVGGYAAEALVRGGVGELEFTDGDVFSESNLNRQILALRSTLGKSKAEAAAERAKDINPSVKATARTVFFGAQTEESFDFSSYDYVVDAIDCVTDKLLLIERCARSGTPVISCMGAGNKLDPMAFVVADIYETSVCPLARVMRRELKKRGINGLKVVYSREEPVKREKGSDGKRPVTGSVSFVPAAAGLLIASEVIKDLIK